MAKGIWHTFDTLPESERPLLVIEVDHADMSETGIDWHSAILIHAQQEDEGFGQAIFRTDYLNRTSEKLSHHAHAGLKANGRWAYLSEVIQQAHDEHRWEVAVFVNGDRPFEGNVNRPGHDPEF